MAAVRQERNVLLTLGGLFVLCSWLENGLLLLHSVSTALCDPVMRYE